MTIAALTPPHPGIQLGLRENWSQFSLLVLVNAFVGAMVGLERSILPAIAEQDFELAAKTAMLSFIMVFGVAKAITNYGAGRLCRSFRAQACADRRMARRGSGAVPPDVGADLELGSDREPLSRHQSGTDLVNDGDHEDRPGRRETARSGHGPE